MADLKPQFLKTCEAESTKPLIERLYGNRYRVRRRLDASQGLAVTAKLFTAYGTGDVGDVTALPDLADLRLINTGQVDGDRSSADKRIVELVYETLTDQLVDEVKPVVDYDLNGLKRITHKLIGLPDIDLDAYDFVVGESEHATGGLILAQFKDESDDAATRVTAVYLKPGVVSKATGEGPVVGTLGYTWKTWLVDCTNAIEMAAAGAGGVIPGVVLAEVDDNVQGYKVRSFSTMAAAPGGSITGVKTTYADVVEVETPGTVALTTVAITAGGLTGTDAIINVTPPRRKTIAATVTVSVETAPATVASPAYNLENISCSVTNTRANFAYKGSDIYTTVSGSNSVSVAKYGASIGADISQFPGCYIVGATTATGSFTYTAGSEASGLNTSSVVVTALTATASNKLTASGATSATGYTTTGVLRRKSRPILTALDGTIYWEVITWSV